MSTVQQLARELGLTSQEVMARLAALGRPADSHLSVVDEETEQRLRREFRLDGRPAGTAAGPGETAPAPTPERPTGGGNGPGARPEVAVPEEQRAPERPQVVDASATSTHRGTVEPERAPERPQTGDAREAGARIAREAPSTRRRSVLAQILEFPALVVVAFAIAVVIKTFLVQAFYIPSGSMLPTLQVGDRVLVEKLTYRFDEPQRGQIVVFERSAFGRPAPEPDRGPVGNLIDDVRDLVRELLGLPVGAEQDYIKRIVAVGGDVISYTGTPRRLEVNGEVVPEPYVRGRDRSSGVISARNCRSMEMRPAQGGCRVPAGTVFVMGDNRGDSQDSRFFGPVELDKIVGRAFLVIWPPEDFGGL